MSERSERIEGAGLMCSCARTRKNESDGEGA